MFGSEGDRFFAICRLGADCISRLLQHLDEVHPDKSFIFGYEDTNAHAAIILFPIGIFNAISD
jgi:hypothetical protein